MLQTSTLKANTPKSKRLQNSQGRVQGWGWSPLHVRRVGDGFVRRLSFFGGSGPSSALKGEFQETLANFWEPLFFLTHVAFVGQLG